MRGTMQRYGIDQDCRNTKARQRLLRKIMCQQSGNPEEMDTFLETYNLLRLNDKDIKKI